MSIGGLRFEKIKHQKPNTTKKPIHILSCGAGINTTALLTLIHKKELPCNEIIFADTDCELPETYTYIKKTIQPLCNSMKLEFTVVKAPIPLYNYCLSRNIIPTRKHRDCTDKFKIQPIHRYLTYKYPKNKFQIYTYLGIAADETKRINKKTLDITLYPLIDQNINRAKCIQIIQEHGLPVPVKSGCFFCPFQPETSWYNLWKKHRQLYKKATHLELNCSRYPEMFLPYPHIGTLTDLEVHFKNGHHPAEPTCNNGQVTLEQSCEWCEISNSCFSKEAP